MKDLVVRETLPHASSTGSTFMQTNTSLDLHSASLASTGLSRPASTPALARPLSRHYQRSACNNPRVATPKCSENPIQTMGKLEQFDPLVYQRPINKRTYWCPSFWVEEVERSGGNKGTYLDYTLSQGFHDFWIDMSNREKKSMEGWKRQSEAREERKEQHRELRKTLSTPKFWRAIPAKHSSWRP
jgi:hypothetical protein